MALSTFALSSGYRALYASSPITRAAVRPQHAFGSRLEVAAPQRSVVAQVAAAPMAAPEAEATVPWWKRPVPENVKHISSVQEMVDELAENREKLVVAEFFAPWCAACRALFPKMVKMAKEHPDVVFLMVNFDESRALVKGLNVKVLPYFHFYRGAEGRVDAFSASLTKVQRLRDAIEVHGAPRCSLGGPAPLEEFPGVVAGATFLGQGTGGSGSSFSGSIDVAEGAVVDPLASCGACGGEGQLPPPIVVGPYDTDALMA